MYNMFKQHNNCLQPGSKALTEFPKVEHPE